MDSIHLMIVDDREEICREMSMAIELSTASTSTPIHVVATALDGYEAMEKVDACKPDIILMDLEMPGLGGLSTSKRIKENHPDILILALTIHDSPATHLAIKQAKMNGLISKGTSLSTIVGEIIQCCTTNERSKKSINY